MKVFDSGKKIMLLLGALLVLAFLLPDNSFANFAQPIVEKTNEISSGMITIIRAVIILICVVIFFIALFTGRVPWKWTITVVLVALLAGPGFTPLRRTLGVEEGGAQQVRIRF